MNRFLPLILIAATALAAPMTVRAQEDTPESQTYDPSFTGRESESAKQIRDMQAQSRVDKGFIKPQTVHVSIVKMPYMEDGQFGLQMAVPDVVSGCYDLTPLEYEANFVDPYFLDIKVRHYRRVTPAGADASKPCNKQNKMSTAMMVLSKDDLKQRGTQEIRFSTESATDKYRIQLDGTAIQLVPESMVVFKAQNLGGNLNDRIVHNFIDSNVIALHVPMANPGDNVSAAIQQFAMTRAMSPAPNVPPSTSGQGSPVFYFYDQGGVAASQIGPDGYGELGVISVNRPYDGPQGRTFTPVELSVFVTRPGTNL